MRHDNLTLLSLMNLTVEASLAVGGGGSNDDNVINNVIINNNNTTTKHADQHQTPSASSQHPPFWHPAHTTTTLINTTLDPSDAATAARSYLHLFLAVLGMLTLTLTAIVANLLVVVIFFRHRRLRRCKNVYLVGLSLADLGVGLCMPLGLADEMLDAWSLPPLMCRGYLVVRDSLLFISLLSVLQVSADRWWSVHKPFNYRVKQSKSMATTILAATWLLTFLVHLPVTGLYDVIAALMTSSSPEGGDLRMGQWLGEEGGGTAGSVRCVEEGAASAELKLCGWVTGGEAGEGGDGDGDKVSGSLTMTRNGLVSGGWRHCDVPYRHDVVFVVTLTTLRYLAPFLFLLALNLTLYSKISSRKRLQVRRSISGIDTVLFSLLKASASDTDCNNHHHDPSATEEDEDNNELMLLRAQRAERRLSRLSPAPLNRRHTMSQILLPGTNSSPSATTTNTTTTTDNTTTITTTTTTTTTSTSTNTTYKASSSSSSTHLHRSPRPSLRPPPLRRRVSLQDCLQNSGYYSSSSLQVPRRKSHGLTQSLSDSLLPTSRRASRDDLAKDMLLRQDKKAACFLGLLQGVLFVCWTPFTVVTIVDAATSSTSTPSSSTTSSSSSNSSLVPHWTRACCLWLLLANSAINPFLYGLLNEDFSKVVMAWFKIKASKRDRLKIALRRFSMHIAVEMEKNGYYGGGSAAGGVNGGLGGGNGGLGGGNGGLGGGNGELGGGNGRLGGEGGGSVAGGGGGGSSAFETVLE